MARGPKKHLKRVHAPKSWMMNKMGGVFTVKPSAGPHKARDSIPLQIILRDKLKLALNGREAKIILNQKEGLVRVDGCPKKDIKYPCGFMDVIDIPKLATSLRVLYDNKGRFTFVKINAKESQYKICKIVKKQMGPNKIPYVVTHDGRTIRFLDNNIKINDSIIYNLKERTVTKQLPFNIGAIAMISDGSNRGRVGSIVHISKLDGDHDLITLKDSLGHTFTTRIGYVFIIGVEKSEVKLPSKEGLSYSIIEEQKMREEAEE